MRLTKKGQELKSWLKHWEMASRITQGQCPTFTKEVEAEERAALRLFGRMVESKYRAKG